MELMQTDLPEPVCPATSMCGALARSMRTGLPTGSTPMTAGIAMSAQGELKMFPNGTTLRSLTGMLMEQQRDFWRLVYGSVDGK